MHGMLDASQDAVSSVSGPPWFALLVEAGREGRATHWLTRQRYPVYWPKYRGVVKLNRHRRAMRYRSVIPGYVFLPHRSDRDLHWQFILKAPGVRSVLKNASADYARLSNDEIEAIRNIEAALNSSALCAAEGIPFKIGDMVQCTDSTLSDWRGPIIGIEKGRKIIMEIRLLGRAIRVTVPVSAIERV